jgi:hypothetical protein
MRGILSILGLALIAAGTYRISVTTCCLVVGSILLTLAVAGSVLNARQRDPEPAWKPSERKNA